ncbi:ArsR family transcriptional regulator [Kordiimonas sediminis]|uniref:ArsR family transcriptional regulator n=1 Tax=Kordiimonas sediminis TaxID=1735581 RepID=A0A919E8B0_9PROT|nr:metalloregulator ArsR/SmtB family transcription factor [Kordiimonas sediminis]GHF24050.1 ArsR family transcriptional regulator [Kordiimonas sediminis]
MERLLTELRAAGEATRLRILALLRHGELTVGEIVQVLDQSQPRVSRHLKLLCDANLLVRFQEGTLVFYRLADQGRAESFSSRILPLLGDDDPVIQDDETRLRSIREANFKKAQTYFRENAASWDEIRSLYVPEEQVEACLLSMVETDKHATLLDVGTGTGRMLELFAGRISAGIGIDVSRDMLAVARSNLAKHGVTNCTVRQGDMYSLDLADQTQDLVILHQVLHFADKPKEALAEAARVLAPGGTLLVADFAPHAFEKLREDHAHRRLGFADVEMEEWAMAAGLKVADTRHFDGSDLVVTVWKLVK